MKTAMISSDDHAKIEDTQGHALGNTQGDSSTIQEHDLGEVDEIYSDQVVDENFPEDPSPSSELLNLVHLICSTIHCAAVFSSEIVSVDLVPISFEVVEYPKPARDDLRWEEVVRGLVAIDNALKVALQERTADSREKFTASPSWRISIYTR